MDKSQSADNMIITIIGSIFTVLGSVVGVNACSSIEESPNKQNEQYEYEYEYTHYSSLVLTDKTLTVHCKCRYQSSNMWGDQISLSDSGLFTITLDSIKSYKQGDILTAGGVQESITLITANGQYRLVWLKDIRKLKRYLLNKGL